MNAARAPGGPAAHDLQRNTVPLRPIGRSAPQGDCMTWQTPTAIDFRFGFEITMYVAAR